MLRRIAVAALASAALGVAVPAALGDIDPIRMTVSAPATVYQGSRATIRITLDADQGAFDAASAPIRARVKLARRCGGDFEGTTGHVAIDKVFTPQPSKGSTLHAVATGKPKMAYRATYTVCVFVTDADDRQYVSDVDSTLTVRKKPAKKHKSKH